MFPTILQRAILRELALVFTFALMVLLGILLLVSLFDDRWQACADLVSFLRVVQWLVPALLPQTVPAALLFATCQVYGRLRRDQELLAMQAGGIHLRHAAIPVFAMGFVLSAIIWVLSFSLIPKAEFLACEAIMKQAEAVLHANLRTTGRISLPPYTIYARQVQGTELIDPIVERVGDDQTDNLVMRASRGELRIDNSRRLLLVRLQDGALVQYGKDSQPASVDFKAYVWKIPLPDGFGTYWPMTCGEMTLAEIRSRRAELTERMKSGETTQPATKPESKRHSLEREIRYLNLEIQKRPAVAVSCLCFAVLGCAAGIYAGFGDTLSAFVACFLPICALHYYLMVWGLHLTVSSGWPPELTMWWADAIAGICGIAMFRRVNRQCLGVG